MKIARVSGVCISCIVAVVLANAAVNATKKINIVFMLMDDVSVKICLLIGL